MGQDSTNLVFTILGFHTIIVIGFHHHCWWSSYHIPIDLDCIWNYSFCEWIDLGVEIEEDWYSVGNIEYDALDDLRVDFS
jgi:hypothetical protein